MVRLGAKAPLADRLCQNCQEPFTPRRVDQVNCSGGCKEEYKNRAWNRAMSIYPWVYNLVVSNGTSSRGQSLNAITQAARRWRDEDRGKGRKPPRLPGDWPRSK